MDHNGTSFFDEFDVRVKRRSVLVLLLITPPRRDTSLVQYSLVLGISINPEKYSSRVKLLAQRME